MDSIPIDPRWASDPGHELGSQPMASLKGGCAAAPMQMATVAENTGPVRGDLANATDKDSPTSGFVSGDTWTYKGASGGVGGTDNKSTAS